MALELKKNEYFAGPKGPVLLVVLDGVGIGQGDEADAVKLAATPTLDALWAPGARATLRAHGTAVGLPCDGDMGNSEVGHNALGAGRVFDQGASLVRPGHRQRPAVRGRDLARHRRRAASATSSALHFIGLLSDGNVHQPHRPAHRDACAAPPRTA